MNKIQLRTNLDCYDKYIDYIQSTYDINIEKSLNIEIPLIDKNELNSFEWNIGLICGGSGSGKSTILKHQFSEPMIPTYNNDKPIISQFEELEPEEVCNVLESVGLSSVPVWLRKPSELSVGEKARLDLCWVLIKKNENKILVFDEFTSTINREVAKSLAFALQRYVRKKNIKVVISSCHFDIIDFLQPDWIFNLNKRIDGEVELEHVEYTDSSYINYQSVNKDDILTKEYKLDDNNEKRT